MTQLLIAILAVGSLVVGLGAGLGYFQGWIEMQTFKTVFLLASVAWFLLAILWSRSGRRTAS
jgi:hypothetical protein